MTDRPTEQPTERPSNRLTDVQMLSRRIAAKASPLRSATAAVAARRLPIVQQRTFLPPYNQNIDERYPAYPDLTDVEDPNMVR